MSKNAVAKLDATNPEKADRSCRRLVSWVNIQIFRKGARWARTASKTWLRWESRPPGGRSDRVRRYRAGPEYPAHRRTEMEGAPV